MSGPQLTALVATVVALAALSGVGLLVLQMRRLRAEVAEARSAVATPAPVSAEVPGTGRAEAEPPDPGPGPTDDRGTVVELLPEPDGEALRRDVIVSPGVQALVEPLARRLVQVSAVSYGVRRALRAENRDRVAALVRRDLRRRRKLRHRAARRAFRVVPLRDADRVQPDARQDWAS